MIADLDPYATSGSSDRGYRLYRDQALAARWRSLVEGLTGGEPEIQKGLNTMWADKANWPARERERFHIDPRVQEFIVEAMKAAPR